MTAESQSLGDSNKRRVEEERSDNPVKVVITDGENDNGVATKLKEEPVVEATSPPRASAASKGKSKSKKSLDSLAGKYGGGKFQEDDEDEDDDDDQLDDDDEDGEEEDPGDLFTEEDLDFLKDVKNPGSRTRRKVIDFKKMEEELRKEEAERGGGSDDDEDEDEDDGEYEPPV